MNYPLINKATVFTLKKLDLTGDGTKFIGPLHHTRYFAAGKLGNTPQTI